ILIGDPKNLDDSPTDATPHVHRIIGILHRKFPTIPVIPVDERHTSMMARRSLLEMGLKKSKRREKGTTDQVAATLMLQEFLQQRDTGA
ncbi:MAG TPA: RuvX/YqgF family protein, partial [Puia sp.]